MNRARYYAVCPGCRDRGEISREQFEGGAVLRCVPCGRDKVVYGRTGEIARAQMAEARP
jgi:Zn ribbon nucleic-acid-binding protein